MLWLALGAMMLLVTGLLLVPMLRAAAPARDRLDHDIQVYRDQLAEIETDVWRGVVSPDEATSAKAEIERRILRAADAGAGERVTDASWRTVMAGILAVFLPVAAVALYIQLGSPNEPGRPLAARDIPAAPAQPPSDDMTALAERLAQRLADNPEDRQGWLLLGRSYWQTGRFDAAADAFGRAAALDDGDPSAHMSQGEALVFAAEGMVTAGAKAAFRRTLALDARHPGARYYLALGFLQAGEPQRAYDAWLALARESPPDAPWMGPLRGRLAEAGAELGIDVETALAALPSPRSAPAAPGPTREDVEAAAEMSDEDRQAFIRSMVQRLADRLAESPDDFEGWMRLGRAYTVLGEGADAVAAFARASGLRPRDPAALAAHAEALIAAADADAPPPAAAIALYRRLLALEPAHPAGLWYTGLADAGAGNYAAAVAAWRRLLRQMNPDSDEYASLQAQIARLEDAAR